MAQQTVNEAIAALKAGDKAEARKLLMAVLDDDPQNEDAWLVLSAAVDDPMRKRQCLETVLEINPDNQVARRGLERLQPPEQAQQAAAQQAAAQQTAEHDEIARAPAPPDATVAAATDPQPAEPAPPADSGDAPPLPTFEQTTAATDVEAPMDAAATAPAPPDAVAAAEVPPDDAQTIAQSEARRRQRIVAIIGIVVGVLLLLMIGVFLVLVYLARTGI